VHEGLLRTRFKFSELHGPPFAIQRLCGCIFEFASNLIKIRSLDTSTQRDSGIHFLPFEGGRTAPKLVTDFRIAYFHPLSIFSDQGLIIGKGLAMGCP
jgi:hypothetical protein